jgi:hypothetical protein
MREMKTKRVFDKDGNLLIKGAVISDIYVEDMLQSFDALLQPLGLELVSYPTAGTFYVLGVKKRKLTSKV